MTTPAERAAIRILEAGTPCRTHAAKPAQVDANDTQSKQARRALINRRRAIIADIKAGLPNTQIAARHGVSRVTVNTYRHRLRKFKGRPKPEDTRRIHARIMFYIRKGLRNYEIEPLVGVSRSAVGKHRKGQIKTCA